MSRKFRSKNMVQKLFKKFKNLITSLVSVMIVLLTSVTNVAAFALDGDSELLNRACPPSTELTVRRFHVLPWQPATA